MAFLLCAIYLNNIFPNQKVFKMKSNNYYNNVYKLISKDFYDKEAHEAIGEWRSHNIYALERASGLLENIVRSLKLKNCYMGQRLKRLVSIKEKILKSKGMRLTKMQDIVGVRLVVKDLRELAKVVNSIKSGELLDEDIAIVKEFNYVKNPKKDGYRSYHIVFEITSSYEGLEYKRLFELQVRTKSQHAWSTVVETIGTYLGIDFKGGEGEKDWQEFFKESSYIFSWFERFEAGKKTLEPNNVLNVIQSSVRLKEVMLKLKITELLDLLNNMTLDISTKFNEEAENDYAIILINYINKNSIIKTYPKSAAKIVNDIYIDCEEEFNYSNQIQVLFVEITSLTDLRKAFPNFYIDVSEFIKILRRYFDKLSSYIPNFRYYSLGI